MRVHQISIDILHATTDASFLEEVICKALEDNAGVRVLGFDVTDDLTDTYREVYKIPELQGGSKNEE